ncbi:hypothetical protein LCL61_06980 [Amycolatopsis coloradensis]|uniref:Uncharacterized protein n=1 Tax=Amycolatopsis coloradensis TaxID=76021 RepID=A0ACD5B7H5_9PSEU
MCRSSSDGGRRCSGSSAHRARALNTVNKQVERAQNAVKAARAAGDDTAEAAAQARLDAAKQRLADTHAAYPLTPDAGIPSPAAQDGDTTPGEDTVDSNEFREDTGAAGRDRGATNSGQSGTTFTNVNYAAPGATVGIQADVVIGGTVVMNGTQVTSMDDLPDHVKRAVDAARKGAARARAAARSGAATVHHSDDYQPDSPADGQQSTHNVASGDDVVPFQIGINLRNLRRR